LLAERIQK